MGNWTSDKTTEYRNHRLTADAKHFPTQGDPQNGGKHAATFLSIVDGTKNGEDIFIDVKVEGKRAESLAQLKKGQEVSVSGTVEFSLDRNGKLRGKIWQAKVSLGQAVRESLKAAAPADEAPAPSATDEAPAFA